MALINNQTNGTFSKDIKTYDPEKIQLSEADSVESRLANIASGSSPLIQNARLRGTQSANQRGLLNSSIAIGEADRAVYDYALPIASQDAQTSFQSKQLNQAAANDANQFGANAFNQGAFQERQGEQSLQQLEKQGEIQQGLIGQQLAADKELQGIRGQQALEQIGAQGEQSIKQLGIQGQQALEQISAQGDIESRLITERGQQNLEAIGYQGEIQSKLQAEQGDIQKQLQDADAATREKLLERQGEINELLQRIQGEQSLQQISAQGIETRLSLKTEQEYQAARDAVLQQYTLQRDEILASQDINRDQLAAQLTGERDQALAQLEAQRDQRLFENEKALQSLTAQQQQDLATLENQWGNLRQQSQSASYMMATSMEAISAILANPEITVANKQQLVDQQVSMLNSGLTLIDGISKMDPILMGGGANPGGPTETTGLIKFGQNQTGNTTTVGDLPIQNFTQEQLRNVDRINGKLTEYDKKITELRTKATNIPRLKSFYEAEIEKIQKEVEALIAERQGIIG